MTEKIFLNYRRADSEAWADRLFERLVKRFSRSHVFMDIDGNIPVGLPWAEWLDRHVAGCDLMLVLIGRTWVANFQERGDEPDYVRLEIESALARQIPVVPVLLGDTPLPSAAELPESMRALPGLEAARLQRLSFDADAEALLRKVVHSIQVTRKGGEPAAEVSEPPVAAKSSNAVPLQAQQTAIPEQPRDPRKKMAEAIAASKNRPRAKVDIHWMLIGGVANTLQGLADAHFRQCGEALEMAFESKAFTKEVLHEMWLCLVLTESLIKHEMIKQRFSEERARITLNNREELKNILQDGLKQLS
jgi:hypothetical protein